MGFALDFRPYPGMAGVLTEAEVPWDTDLYGLPVVELRCVAPAAEVARALPPWRALRRPAFVQTRVAPDDLATVEALCANGFYPAETTLDLSLPLRRLTPLEARAADRPRLRRAGAGDVAALAAIARETFRADRFHLDPHLPSERTDARYAGWVERGFAAGDRLYAYEAASGEAVGFYLVRGEPGAEVDLSLAGVTARHRGTGLGAMMYSDMLVLCRDEGFRTAVTRVTATNLDVLNLFTRLGFTIRAARLTLHAWLT
jgi:ribosomal protein S18 acetylase RimI-like enzyme